MKLYVDKIPPNLKRGSLELLQQGAVFFFLKNLRLFKPMTIFDQSEEALGYLSNVKQQ